MFKTSSPILVPKEGFYFNLRFNGSINLLNSNYVLKESN